MLAAISLQIGTVLGTLLSFCLTTTDIETFYPAADFCEGSSFSAECGVDEVIMINSAVYGRMYAGTCIVDGSLGCQEDVNGYLDKHCSGRQACSVKVVDVFQSIPAHKKPCPSNFRGFLEVSYKCIRVTQASGDCEINLNSLNSPVGYLTSILKDQTSCGSIENPWVFTGMREQSIQFNLYNFSGGGSTGNQAAKETCTVYLTIKERELHEYYTVCQSNKRQSAVYSSKSSHVEIRIHQRENEYFLVKFEVQGCISFPVPESGWMERTGQVVEMGCDGTSNTWKLHCKDNKWVGTIGNCSHYPSQPRSDASVGNGDSLFVGLFGSHWLAALAISAIAFTVALSILVTGIVYLKRKQLPVPTGNSQAGHPQYKYSTGTGHAGTTQGQLVYGQDTTSNRPFDPNDNEYLKTIERQRLMLIGQHPQQHFAPKTDNNIRWQDGEHIYELPQFDNEPFRAKKEPNPQGFQKQSFELSPRKPVHTQGPSPENLDSNIRNVNNRSV